MENKINKFKKSVSNHPRLYVVILLIIVLFITLIIFRIADKYINTNHIEIKNYFDINIEDKTYFEANVSINKKGVINSFEQTNGLTLTSNPLYSNDMIVFPKEMIMVFPNKNYAMFKSISFSYIKRETNEFISKDFNNYLEDYFMYDGDNLYFVANSGTLTVNDEKIELSKNSVIWSTGDYVKYYDSEKDEIKKIDIIENSSDVIFESALYYLNMTKDKFSKEGNILPKDTSYLENISKFTEN